ncbi:hypothetical protein [Clostridium sp. B9]|uniref:hypothetical protein n=1 Tax=Clostridium sp. B9 TaxID=3423224 RepID=UPI003D2ECAE8
MNKKFSNIIFIGSLVILILLIGINTANNFKNIKINNIYGNRSEIGDVDISVTRRIGSFFVRNYKVGADSVSSETKFIDETYSELPLYGNKDVLRGVYTNTSNSYHGDDYLAVVDILDYDKGKMNLILKNKKTGEIKEAKVKNPYGRRILGVYGENNKIKILMPENDYDNSSPIIVMEYNFETKDFKKIASHGVYSEKMGLEYRDGANYYIGKMSMTYDENKGVEEGKNFTIYKANLKENTFKDYDVRKILEENQIDLKGKSLESLECDGNLIYVTIAEAPNFEEIFKDEKKMAEYEYGISEEPRVYSVATINVNDLKVNYYKDIINEKEIEGYLKGHFKNEIAYPLNLRVLGDKLYFVPYGIESDLVVVGVADLKSEKLVYLGEMNNVVMNGFYENKK